MRRIYCTMRRAWLEVAAAAYSVCRYATRSAIWSTESLFWKPGILARPISMMSITRSSFAGMPLVMYFFLEQPVHAGTAQVALAVGVVTLGAARVVYPAATRLLRVQAQFRVALARLGRRSRPTPSRQRM